MASSSSHDLDLSALNVERFSDPDLIERELVTALRDGKQVSWDPRNLANGYAGIALSTLSLIDGQGAVPPQARRLLRLAVDASKRTPFESLGLFDGASGLAYAINIFANEDARYRKSWESFHKEILRNAQNRFSSSREHTLSSSDLDVISGISGILMYLNAINPSDRTYEEREALAELSRVLSDTVQAAANPLTMVPGEWAPPGATADDSMWAETGIAHGAAGVLLALATSKISSSTREASSGLEILTGAFLDQAHMDAGLRVWARAISDSGEPASGGAYPAWCFGNVGIELALLRAGEANGESALTLSAAHAIHEHIDRYVTSYASEVRDACICHGVGGMLLMHACVEPYLDTNKWNRTHQNLRSVLRGFVDLNAPFVFPSPGSDTGDIHDPSYLMGSAGAALVLLHEDHKHVRELSQLMVGKRG